MQYLLNDVFESVVVLNLSLTNREMLAMASSKFLWNLAVLVAYTICGIFAKESLGEVSFDQNYGVTWGSDHVSHVNQGREIQLSLDTTSGAAFTSKMSYSSGFFQMRIKLPNKGTAGVVTAFYLISQSQNHGELDFEFLGNVKGKPIALQTNVFANGHGSREQRIHLWFDPAQDFHDYAILWNPYQVVFYVDNIPIRIYKNSSSSGVEYPTQPMKVMGSIWNGEDWATEGGRIKIDWALSPFQAQFQGFAIQGCSPSSKGGRQGACSSPQLWWNVGRYKELTPNELVAFQNVKAQYLFYDYCNQKPRSNSLAPPECRF